MKTCELSEDGAGLHETPRKWRAFDGELFIAVMRYASGELKRNLVIYQEASYAKGVQPSGRYAFWSAIRDTSLSAARRRRWTCRRSLPTRTTGT